MDLQYSRKSGWRSLGRALSAGGILWIAHHGFAEATPIFSKAPMTDDANPVILVQATNEATAQASDQPVSANDLKAAIQAIKDRLAKQQEGRQTTGAGELALELKNARETIADLTDSLSRLRGERDAILSELRKSSDELDEKAKRIASLQQSMADNQASSNNRLAELQGQLEQTSSERTQIQKQAEELERRLQSALIEIGDLTQTVKQAWTDRDAVEQSLKEAREAALKEVESRDTALGDAQAKLAEIESRLADRIAEQDTLNAEMAGVRQALAEQTQAAEAAAAEIGELNNQLAESQTVIEANQADLEQAEGDKQRLNERIQQVEREAEGRLRERTQTLTTNLATANDRIVELETELQGLREVATTSVAEVEVLGGQLLEALQENEIVLAALSEVRASNALLDTELEAARKDIVLYSSQASNLRGQLASEGGAEAGSGGTQIAASADQTQKLQEAQAEIERLTEELFTREERLREADQDQTALNSLNERISSLEEQLRGSETARGQLEAELTELRQQGQAAEIEAQLEPEPAAAPERLPAPEIVVASSEPIDEINAFLVELNAVETDDGWLMTVPDGIVFAPGSDELALEASPALSKIASLINYYDGSNVRIVGHTDSFGDASVNRDLSLRRANSVREFLSENYGIPTDQIATDGLGEELPIASNDTISGRRANRRVEIYVRP